MAVLALVPTSGWIKRKILPAGGFIALTIVIAASGRAQTVTATIPLGIQPFGIALNPITNKIYIANINAGSPASVSVLDGATNSVVSVPAGTDPTGVAVNPVTNKIYVTNRSDNTVTVIDGASNNTTLVTTGTNPVSVALNPVTNKIYTANTVSNNVTIIDGATNTTTTVSTGPGPASVAVNPVTNQIYVADSGSNTVTVIDGATNNTMTVTVGRTPFSLEVNPVTNKIYVLSEDINPGVPNVTVIDGATNTPTMLAIAGTGLPSALAVNPVTNKIYVTSSGGDNLTVIDGATNTITSLAVGTDPLAVAVNPVTNKIFIANYNSSSATVVDGATNNVTTLSVGASPWKVAANPVTGKIYMVNETNTPSQLGTVTVIDDATDTTTTVAAGTNPSYPAVNPVTNKIYVANENSSNVTVIDEATNNTTTVPVGSGPAGIVVNPSTNKIYVSNGFSNNVTVIDGVSNSTATVAAGTYPWFMAVNPVTNKIYVANDNSNNVTVIDGATNNTTTVVVGTNPVSVAVNPVTNQIYVANKSSGNVTVIDGASDNTTTVAVGGYPNSVTVNPVTNKIYVATLQSVTVIDGVTNNTTVATTGDFDSVAVNPVTNQIYATNFTGNSVAVINGATNNTTSVTAGTSPNFVVVNPTTNKIYVANLGSSPSYSGTVTVIDGATNNAATVPVGSYPFLSLAVNPVTNKIYCTNQQSNNVTVITEQQVQSIPLTTTITPLPNNQTGSATPSFTFSASSTFNPTATTPEELLFQADTWQGPWNTATGSNPSYTGTLAKLLPGFHILYAYAVDGQDATATQVGSPLTGAIQAYGFLVTASALLLPQTVTFVNLPTQAAAGTSITLSASANTPVTFSSPSSASICSVSGSTLTFNGVGTCTVTATAAQTSVYQSATTSQNIAVLLGQTITFGSIPVQIVGIPLALSATATSGLTVAFASTTTGICTVSGTAATFVTPGTCTIVASQSGNSTYIAANPVSQSFTVQAESGLGFIPATPCRVVDTRGSTSALGGPTMLAGSTRSFPLPTGSCNLPSTAAAYSLNVTVVPNKTLQYLSLWPTGQSQPLVSTLNSFDGRIVANAAIVPAGTAGEINVYVTDQTDVIIDVDGYFAAAGTAGALTFVPVTPCRVGDTRNAVGPLGGPTLSAGSSRSFPVPSSACSIPSTAAAYSLNATVVPATTLGYLTLYPTGQAQPYVSTLNSYNGQVVANAAIVPAGTGGAITAYVTDQTDLITDINGYFTATPATPLVFNTVTPCRVADTRNANGTFGGPIMAAGSTRSFPIPTSTCGIPASATAYALNVTVVPTSTLGYLTLWPAGQTQPVVSTLNSYNGQVVANAALVPAGSNGAVDVFVTDLTHVIIDIVGYFSAP